MKLFDAAREANFIAIQQCLAAGAGVHDINEYGFTALHAAAMALNNYEAEQVIPCLQLLINAGADINAKATDGRSVLYLAAEFAQDKASIEFLVAQGAEANVYDRHGNHIVINACADDVQEYLAAITGFEIPEPETVIADRKLSAAEWKKIKTHLDVAFKELQMQKIIALQDAGETQADGFADCAEIYHRQGGTTSDIEGFCFYTRQDQNRAKRTSKLPLAFIATDEKMENNLLIAKRIRRVFEEHGFIVLWNEDAQTRPEIYLIR